MLHDELSWAHWRLQHSNLHRSRLKEKSPIYKDDYGCVAWISILDKNMPHSPAPTPSQTYKQTHNGLCYTNKHTSESEEDIPPFILMKKEKEKWEDEVLYGILSHSLCTIPHWVSEEH